MSVFSYAKYLPIMMGTPAVPIPARTARWRLNEALATDNFADSIGTRHLTQTGNPGVGGTYRTFDLTQYAKRSVTGDNTLGLVNLPYTLFAHFRAPNPVTDARTCQVVSLREAGSGSGNLTLILRRENNALKYYHGNGAGSLVSTAVATLSNATDHKFMIRLPTAGGSSLTYTNDGTNWTTWNTGLAGCTVAPTNFNWAIGGDVNELWLDRIYDASLWVGTVLTDEEAAAVFAEGD